VASQIVLTCRNCKKSTSVSKNSITVVRLYSDEFNVIGPDEQHFIMSPCCCTNNYLATPELKNLYVELEIIKTLRGRACSSS
jgi:hypothetical protein